MRDRLHSDPRRDAHLDAPQWPVSRMATRAGTLARIKLRAAAPAIVEGRCCMNTRCGWGGVARTSRDPPQEPHYGDEVEGSSQV